MKQTIRRAVTRTAAAATLLLSVTACSDKFLQVTNPNLIDAATVDFAAAWPVDSEAFRAEVARWQDTLGDLALQIGVTDARADIIYSNLGLSGPVVNLSDREHIRVHLDRLHKGLFVSRPVVGRVSRKASIQFSRAIERDGGVVVERKPFRGLGPSTGQRTLIRLGGSGR